MAEEARRQVNSTTSRFTEFCQTNPYQLHLPIPVLNHESLDHVQDCDHIPPTKRPNGEAQENMTNVRCCCGRDDCAYLKHNNVALGGLERDLETAARLGQALLQRHESYVKESQEERTRLSSYISDLEAERASLQSVNEKFVTDNRNLLEKLQTLNTNLADSGEEVHRLEGLLRDCENEVRRLNGLAMRTEDLEDKILRMERDREELSKLVEDGQQENRSTIARWKESQRRVRELEQEVEKIEWEAQIEREKHERLAIRVEKDKSLERELGLSEGRLKATAAISSMKGEGSGGKAVVSNFVRDILQDNATLQSGIEELRQLLQSSNEEVQNLRDQVLQHQPMQDDESGIQPRSLSLSEELTFSQSPPKHVQREVHVHHHYHAKPAAKTGRPGVARKSSRRRAILPSSAASTTSGSSTPSTPLVKPKRVLSGSFVPINLAQGHQKANRWSMQSNVTASTYLSSMASSPTSHLDRNSSIFDRIEREEDSSRPTSPESLGLSSPLPWRRKDPTEAPPLTAFAEEDSLDDTVTLLDPNAAEHSLQVEEISLLLDLTPKASMANKNVQDVPESSTQLSEPRPPDIQPPNLSSPTSNIGEPIHEVPVVEVNSSVYSVLDHMPEIRPSIRRRNSCDSLVSISGMDIHLAQRPSHNSTLSLIRGNRHHFAHAPIQARSVAASQPLASVTEFTATSRHGVESIQSQSLLALSGLAPIAKQIPRRESQGGSNGGIGKLVGGWVQRTWGVAPTKSSADLRIATPVKSPGTNIHQGRPSSLSEAGESESVSSGKGTPVRTFSASTQATAQSSWSRTPGINQPGMIPGFAALAAKRAPTEVQAAIVDFEGLQESLAG